MTGGGYRPVRTVQALHSALQGDPGGGHGRVWKGRGREGGKEGVEGEEEGEGQGGGGGRRREEVRGFNQVEPLLAFFLEAGCARGASRAPRSERASAEAAEHDAVREPPTASARAKGAPAGPSRGCGADRPAAAREMACTWESEERALTMDVLCNESACTMSLQRIS